MKNIIFIITIILFILAGSGFFTISAKDVGMYHGQIAQKIGTTGLVDKALGGSKIYTLNVHGNITENTLWQIK
jgi:uncharacterized membrane protein